MSDADKIFDEIIGAQKVRNPELRALIEERMKQGGTVVMKQGGIAQYGLRHDSGMPKGNGYFGPLKTEDGVMTELSAADESGDFPLLVPTLTKKELQLLTSGGQPTEEIYSKARAWAKSRKEQGRNPFATGEDLRMPVPEFAKGGEVHAANGLPLTFAQDKEDPDALQNWMRERRFGKVDIPAPYKVKPEEVTVARAMKAAPAAPVDEVTQGEYGPRERLRELLQKGLGKGMSKSGAARSADILTDAASFVAPPMWGYEGGQSLGRAYDAAKQGDYGTAAIEGGLGALNLLPALPGAKVIGQAAGRAAKDVSPAAREVLHDALHSGMESGLIQGPAYVFIGPKAKTFDKKAAKQFEKMEAAGAPLNKTWQEARTFRSPDQMLRQEVGDEPSRLKRERQYDLEVEFGDVKKRIAAEEDRLNELRQSGQISPEEFDAQMDQVVGPLLGARADIAMEYGKTGKMSGPVREHALKYPTLSKVMYHPELFKAYPSLKTVRAGYGVDKNLESIKGYFSPSQNRMYAESNYTPLTRNILLHEIQHAIQGIEGFGRGSNVSRSISEMLPPDMSENDLIDQLRRSIANMKNRQSEIRDIVGDNKNIYSNDLYKPLALEHINLTKTIEDSNKAIEDIIQQGNSHRIYLRSAGEAEARAAQKRWNMTPEERAATHPLESYDVPLDQLIVKR